MSKSLIYTALTAPVDVLAGGAIPLGTIIRRYGCAVNLNGNGIALSDVAVGKMILEKAEAQGVGTMLTLMEEADIIR